MAASKSTIEAQIAQEQLIQTLQDVVSSSLKVCQLSLLVGLRNIPPDTQFKGAGRLNVFWQTGASASSIQLLE